MTNDEVRSSAAAVSVHGSAVLIGWEDYSTNNKRSDVEILRSTDRGATWSGRESVAPAVNGCPDFAVDSRGVVHASLCSWDHAIESRGYNYEIYYRRSRDGGVTWDPRVRLTDDQVGDSRFPVVAEGNGAVHVVWWDDRDGNYEIYFKISHDRGATWSDDARLTTGSERSKMPSMDVDSSGTIHLMWTEHAQRGGTQVMYIKGR